MAMPTDPIQLKAYLDLLAAKNVQDWQKQVLNMLTVPNQFLIPSPPKPQTATEIRAKMDEARRRFQDKQDNFALRYGNSPQRLKDQLNGQHRRPNPQTYGNPVKQPDPRDDGADAYRYAQLATFPGAITYVTCPKPRPLPYAGIRTGEIIGHRAWFVVAVEDYPYPRLCSLAHRYIWQPREIITGKINEIVEYDMWNFPPKNIYGGVYAFHDAALDATTRTEIKAAQLELPRRIFFSGIPACVFAIAVGTIEMWGDVVEHETGYRASHAKLKSIDGVHGVVDIKELREVYHV